MSASLIRRAGQAIAALSAAIIVYATLSPSVSAGGMDDQLAHFILFFPLGLGGALWMAQLDPASQRRSRLAALGAILVFAAATEIGQAVVDRDPSFTDFVADAAGTGAGVLLGGLFASRSRRD